MIKTFYRKRSPGKVFFAADMKIRSMAYGMDVHKDFLCWLRRFDAAWNHPKQPFLLGEDGHFSGNPVCRCRTEFMHKGSEASGVVFHRQGGTLHPLWYADHRLEIGKNGELIADQQPTGIILGSELKAWGITVLWTEDGLPSYYLLVLGKPLGSFSSFLSVYSLPNTTLRELPPLLQMPMDSVLNTKSHLYCFGRHIFTVHGAKLNYLYFRPEIPVLETVAIESDTPNDQKACCCHVTPPVVADMNGRVYWQSGNQVYSIPVGYPRRLSVIDGGDQYTHVCIHTYGDSLFLYRSNRLNREYECMRCFYGADAGAQGDVAMSLFNKSSVRNIIYYESGGDMLYLKVPPDAYKITLIRNREGNEQIQDSLLTNGIERVFCDDNAYYIGADYARGK